MTAKEKALKEEARNLTGVNYGEARGAYYQADAALATLQETLENEGPASPELYKIAKALKAVMAEFDTATEGLGNTF